MNLRQQVDRRPGREPAAQGRAAGLRAELARRARHGALSRRNWREVASTDTATSAVRPGPGSFDSSHRPVTAATEPQVLMSTPMSNSGPFPRPKAPAVRQQGTTQVNREGNEMTF